MAAPDRRRYADVVSALNTRGISAADRKHVDAVIALLVEHLGPVTNPYVGQSDNAVGMSFGSSTKVGLYVQPGLLNMAPESVVKLGGHDSVAALYPGFTPGLGQREREARLELPSHRSSTRHARGAPAARGICCGVDDAAGAECACCGEVVAARH